MTVKKLDTSKPTNPTMHSKTDKAGEDCVELAPHECPGLGMKVNCKMQQDGLDLVAFQ